MTRRALAAACSAAALLAAVLGFGGCEGCALLAPEGESGFYSVAAEAAQ